MFFNKKIFFIFIFLFQYISPLLFLLKKGEERCLIDEFIENNYFVVKHKIFTEDKKNLTVFLPHFHLIVKEVGKNKLVYNNNLKSAKAKISQKVEKTSLYKVCIVVNNHIPKELEQMKIYANLKITSDNMEKNDFSNAIKTDDIIRMDKKSDEIIRLINQASEKQKEQINIENENSLLTLSNTKIYKYLNLGQVFVSAIIGLIQLNNFRKFLKSKNIV